MNSYFTLDEKVGAVLDRYPFLVDVMVKEGFTHLGNETMRKTVANHITLKEAFHHHGKEEAEMEKILVDAIETHQNEKK